MSAVQQYLLAIDHDPDEATRVAQEASQGQPLEIIITTVLTLIALQKGKSTFIQVVESLGEYINDDSESIRSKAVRFLVQVLKDLPSNFLSRQQIQVLCQFLCDRIADDGALHGLLVLSQLPRFTSEMAVMTFNAIHAHVGDLQAYAQAKRYEVSSVVNILMTKHRASIRSLGMDSLLKLVDLFAGERDPRNLMIVFSVFRIVTAEWDLGEHSEAVFDAVFCYFPITFRPPPNDPYGITAQDLKTRLKDCISTSPTFAPYAFAQLLLKLDAHSINAKRDVLETLAACATSYGPQTMANYSVTLWDSLKFEVFNAQEEELRDLALAALQATACALQTATDETSAAFTQYLKPIATDCSDRLQEPQSKQAQSAAAIIGALGSTSDAAVSKLSNDCIPPLLRQYKDAENFEVRRAILDALYTILDGATRSTVSSSSRASPLLPFKDQLFQTFSQALMNASTDETAFRISALHCLESLCRCRDLLDASEIGMFIQYLDDIILEDSDTERSLLIKAAIESLSDISRIFPRLVSEIAMPAILARLPDSMEEGGDATGALSCVACLRFDRDLSSTLLRRLLYKSKAVINYSGVSEYLRSLLAAIYLVLVQQDLRLDTNLQSYSEILIEIIRDMPKRRQAGETPSKVVQVHVQVMIMFGRIACTILHAMESQGQVVISQRLYALMSPSGASGSLASNREVLGPSESRILSTFVLAAVNRDVEPLLTVRSRLETLHDLISFVEKESDTAVRLNILQQLALFVNKFLSEQELEPVRERLWTLSNGFFAPHTMTLASVRSGLWIIKALLFRQATIDDIVSPLFDQISDETYGLSIAHGMELLLRPDEILRKDNGAIMRRLAPQKLFNLCLAEVSSRMRRVSAETKAKYIIAISGILKHLSEDVISPRADDLMPLLLQALDLPQSAVQSAAIQTLEVLVRTSPGAVESHVSSLIDRLLKAAADGRATTEIVRQAALRCLESFPSRMKTSALMPYRRAALRGMLRMLDDPRRHVRKSAVDCRAAWMNLDEPDEEG